MIENRLFVLILQHPQEKREALSTAPTVATTLARVKVTVGLSWPNLAQALGRSAAEPRRWAAAYLGSARPSGDAPVFVADRHGAALGDAARLLRGLDGVVLLDGTWSQAKNLWWRNPWLLKLHRLVLNPPHPARYDPVRREPRREALSTARGCCIGLARC